MREFKVGDKVRVVSEERMREDCPESFDWDYSIVPIEKFYGDLFTITKDYMVGISYRVAENKGYAWGWWQLELVEDELRKEYTTTDVNSSRSTPIIDPVISIVSDIVYLSNSKLKAELLRAVADYIEYEA